MHRLLLSRRRGEAAVHHHAGEPIGVEPAELPLVLQQLDHRPGGVVHRLVEVGVPADRDQIDHVLAIRQRFDPALSPRVLGAEAMQALVDVDHLADAAIPGGHHQLFRLLLADLALLHQKIRGLALENVERLVEVAVDADRDPRVFRLDARPLELHVLEHFDRHAHLLVGGLERGQVDLAVALRGMGIAGPQQRALDEHRHVERAALSLVADVEIAAVASGRHRAVLAGLGAGDAQDAGKRRQRDLDAGRKLRDPALEIEIEILDLAVRELARELAEHAGHVEIGAVGPRHDLVDAHFQHVARLGALDIDRPGQRVRAALLDLLDRHAGHELVVRMHHRLEQDGVAGIDVQHRRLGVVEPAPLRGLQGRRQHVDLAGVAFGLEQAKLLLLGGRSRDRRHDRGRVLRGGGGGSRGLGRGGSGWRGLRRGRGRRRRLRLLGARERGGERQHGAGNDKLGRAKRRVACDQHG